MAEGKRLWTAFTCEMYFGRKFYLQFLESLLPQDIANICIRRI